MQLFQLPRVEESDLPLEFVRGVRRLGFSPDGRLLIARTLKGGWLIDTTTEAVRELWAQRDLASEGSGVGFTPDGTGVIAFTDESAVRVYDVETGTVRREFRADYFGGVEPGPGGRVVYVVAGGRSQIVRWDPVTGKKRAAFGGHGGGTTLQLAVSADGNWIAGTNIYEVRLWDLRGGRSPARATRCIAVQLGFPPLLALSADGLYLAAGREEQLWIWDLRSDADGPQALAPGPFGGVAFAPTRPLLLHGSGEDVVFRNPATGAEVSRLCWGIGPIQSVAFAPDGLRCAAGSAAGKVVVWDVDL